VAGDDCTVRSDKDRVRPSKFPDRRGDLRHLLLGMCGFRGMKIIIPNG
jgi:hypothetical protein